MLKVREKLEIAAFIAKLDFQEPNYRRWVLMGLR